MTLMMFWLFTKHILADFFLQTEIQLSQKGDFNRIGGYIHAGIHAVLTMAVFLFMKHPLGAALCAAAVDYVIHYAIDWSKFNIGRKMKTQPNDKAFWWSFGIDQYLHFLTYGLLIYLFT
jgi:hypothetical protein